MAWPQHLAAIAGLAICAWLLVRIPRGLFAEVAGEPDTRRNEALLAAGLIVLGVAAFEAWRGGDPLARVILALCLMTFAAIIVGDIRYLTIPDLYSGVIAAAALAGPLSPGWREALVGATLCGGMLGLVAWFWKRRTAVEGLGFGDVKLAAASGGLLGAQAGLWAITASAAGGAALGLALQARHKGDEDAPLLFPYGAPLALAAAGFLLWGLW